MEEQKIERFKGYSVLAGAFCWYPVGGDYTWHYGHTPRSTAKAH